VKDECVLPARHIGSLLVANSHEQMPLAKPVVLLKAERKA
jgi:hypothetical protein